MTFARETSSFIKAYRNAPDAFVRVLDVAAEGATVDSRGLPLDENESGAVAQGYMVRMARTQHNKVCRYAEKMLRSSDKPSKTMVFDARVLDSMEAEMRAAFTEKYPEGFHQNYSDTSKLIIESSLNKTTKDFLKKPHDGELLGIALTVGIIVSVLLVGGSLFFGNLLTFILGLGGAAALAGGTFAGCARWDRAEYCSGKTLVTSDAKKLVEKIDTHRGKAWFNVFSRVDEKRRELEVLVNRAAADASPEKMSRLMNGLAHGRALTDTLWDTLIENETVDSKTMADALEPLLWHVANLEHGLNEIIESSKKSRVSLGFLTHDTYLAAPTPLGEITA